MVRPYSRPLFKRVSFCFVLPCCIYLDDANLFRHWIFSLLFCGSKRIEEVTVRLGEFHFGWPNNDRRDHDVETIQLHEKFNKTSFDNDIAVIKLSDRADMSDRAGRSGNIWPICLPPPGVQLENKNGYVAGKFVLFI